MSLISSKPWGEHSTEEMLAHHAAYRAMTSEERKAHIDGMLGITPRAPLTPPPAATPASPPPAQPDPALVAEGERILAEIAARKAASAPKPRKRTPEEIAAIDREYDRVQAEWEREQMAKLAHDSVHGFGRAYRPWPARAS